MMKSDLRPAEFRLPWVEKLLLGSVFLLIGGTGRLSLDARLTSKKP